MLIWKKKENVPENIILPQRNETKRKRRSDGVSDVVKSAVLSFFKRDHNSRAMPGKNDAKKVATGVKKQKRILNDYLKNLHLKFLSEEPNMRYHWFRFADYDPFSSSQ